MTSKTSAYIKIHGTPLSWTRLFSNVFTKHSGAGIVLYTTDDQGCLDSILMGKENVNGLWSDFGGKREIGETRWHTAVREFQEEFLFHHHTPPQLEGCQATHSCMQYFMYIKGGDVHLRTYTCYFVHASLSIMVDMQNLFCSYHVINQNNYRYSEKVGVWWWPKYLMQRVLCENEGQFSARVCDSLKLFISSSSITQLNLSPNEKCQKLN